MAKNIKSLKLTNYVTNRGDHKLDPTTQNKKELKKGCHEEQPKTHQLPRTHQPGRTMDELREGDGSERQKRIIF